MASSSASPFIPMFEGFRAELDEHHDRRDRIRNASRDITAASKKIIRKLNAPVPQKIAQANNQYYEIIKSSYVAASNDLQGLNANRYQSNITGGNQEFMEAVIFQHYLETQKLMTYEEAIKKLAEVSGMEAPVILTPEDYLLGIYDMTGELMRFAITAMATSGSLPGGEELNPHKRSKNEADGEAMDVDEPAKEQQAPLTPQRNVLTDLRELRAALEQLDIPHSRFENEVSKKMTVMQQSVEKVEKSLYGLIVRGAERPKGWVPDVRDDGKGREEVESY